MKRIGAAIKILVLTICVILIVFSAFACGGANITDTNDVKPDNASETSIEKDNGNNQGDNDNNGNGGDSGQNGKDEASEEGSETVIDVSYLASDIVESFMKVPDPWAFLPASFSKENKVYAGNAEIDFNSFIDVSSLPKTAMGKQMNVVYSTLFTADKAFGYLRTIYGSMNSIVELYQDFINKNSNNYANYEKQTENFNFKITLQDSDYKMLVAYRSAQIELSYERATEKCYGRIQISDSNVIKYDMSENELTVAVSVLGFSLTKLHFERQGNTVSGYLYEYYGTEDRNIKTSALIKVDRDYTSIISNKREADDLMIEGYMEVYKNSTGNLVGAEVKETVKNIRYETSWFNIWDISGINSVKVEDEINGDNLNTIYINGNANAIHTKLVGGLSLKSLSRRFDIEMKDVYLYVYDREEGYDKVKTEIPMLFVQNDYIASFGTDFYEKYHWLSIR